MRAFLVTTILLFANQASAAGDPGESVSPETQNWSVASSKELAQKAESELALRPMEGSKEADQRSVPSGPRPTLSHLPR